MLISLTIKNFGIIENVTLEFSEGLNILTGETGAGKSILIDALRFALGERFQSTHLRDQAEQCTVEAVFSLNDEFVKTVPHLTDFTPENNAVILQRTAFKDGKNRIRINGLSATATQLKLIGDHLVDLHGPYDHQQLLAEPMHLKIVDALTDFADHKTNYSKKFNEYAMLKAKLAALEDMARTRERDLDLLSHQINELSQVPLTQEHYQAIQQEQIKINNYEKLFSEISLAINILDNDDNGLERILARAARPLEHITATAPDTSGLLAQISNMQQNAHELLHALRHYAETIQFDEPRAIEINRLNDAYHAILRKFGPTLDDARQHYEQISTKQRVLAEFEQNEEALDHNIKDAAHELSLLAGQLTKRRKKTIELLKKTIESELQALGFKSVIFDARCEEIPFQADGQDRIVFYISPNTGESLKPLALIVSSGESARIMLAIKRSLMQVDPVPVLIFDEIDAQIGGRLGTVIGGKLKEIASYRQVILITHLPQIASYADNHFKISKAVRNGRTLTEVSRLNPGERELELAQMMSGEETTAIALKHAKDMLKKARK